MARLQEFYKTTVAPELRTKFGYKSVMEVPRITKITLNMGVGEAVGDKKVLEYAVGDLQKIAGQKPVATRARKSIAKGDDVDAVLESLSRGLTQKMLHGAMAELHAGDAESRERARHAIEHFFLRGK